MLLPASRLVGMDAWMSRPQPTVAQGGCAHTKMEHTEAPPPATQRMHEVQVGAPLCCSPFFLASPPLSSPLLHSRRFHTLRPAGAEDVRSPPPLGIPPCSPLVHHQPLLSAPQVNSSPAYNFYRSHHTWLTPR
jgi:hypothetical protein